jgi:hypothetical protein
VSVRALRLVGAVLGVLACLVGGAEAATIPAASCSAADVQAALNTAVTGDTVTVPAGNCTWTTTVTIASKGVALQGAGINATNITDQGAGGHALLVTGVSATNFVTITGFTFIKDTNHANGMVQISATTATTTVGFRIHHNRWVMGSTGSRGLYLVAYGVVDHNTFDVPSTTGSIQSISIFGSSVSADGGYTPWTRPLTLGTANATYIEDNVFNVVTIAEDSIDAYSGARFVIRYNTFNGAHIGWHGTDSGGMRSPVSHEVYNNTFINNTASKFRAGTVRGGTGVWFNNTYSGSGGWYDIVLMCYRCCTYASSWQVCDGTDWRIGSTSFSAQGSRECSTTGTVRFCSGNRDLVCASDATCSAAGAGTCTTYFDGDGPPGGYRCRDQPGVGPTQALQPIYAWNNGSVELGPFDGNVSCPWGAITTFIAAERDYYNGTVRPGYTPYTYPHPLIGGIPAAPSNLMVTQP